MKKNLIAIAVMCAVLGLTGCGSTVTDTVPQTDETAAAETVTESAAETESSPAGQTTSAVESESAQ